MVLDFKDYEAFAMLKIPKTPFVVRCDGRGFHRLVRELGFEWPYDESFARALVAAARSVFEAGFRPVLAYVFSDEVSYVFIGEETFSRRLEKIVSVIASTLSSAFTLELAKLGKASVAAFDARVIPLCREEIPLYLAWRQADCIRNFYNSYAYHALVHVKGMKPSDASTALRGLGIDELRKIAKSHGVDVDTKPLWQRHGIVLRFELYTKHAVNKLTGKPVRVTRKRLVEDWSPPNFSTPEGTRYIEEAIKAAETHA